MQHIGLQLQNEQSEVLETSDINFAEVLKSLLENTNVKAGKYPFLCSIDPYGDTIFNPIQTQALIKELETLQFKNSVRVLV